MSASTNKSVGLYEPRTPSDMAPDQIISAEYAMYLRDSRQAYSINRGRAVRLVYPSTRIRCGSAECGETSAAIMRKQTPDAEWIAYGR